MFWLLSMASTLGKNLSKSFKNLSIPISKPFKNSPQIIQNRISTTTISPIKCCWNVILSFPVCLVIYSTD